MKNRLYCLLIFAIAIQACKEDVKEVAITAADIAHYEGLYQKEKDTNSGNDLLAKYAEYMNTYPADSENNSKFLRRSAQIYQSSEDYMKAAGATVMAIKQFYNASATEANIAALISYYQSLGNQDAAETTMNGYIMAYPQGDKVSTYTKALGDKKQTLTNRLTQISAEVVSTSADAPGINKEAVNKFIGVAEIYALTNNSKDTLASDYLFKAGKLAMTIGNTEKAIECYQWIYNHLTSSKEAPSALFTHAFTLDSQLGKKEEAKVLYEQFIKDYPDHHFANDATFQLKNLGKDAAEIIDEFNKKTNSK